MATTKKTARVSVYRAGGDWCSAVLIDGDLDHADLLDIADDATEAEAMEAAAAYLRDRYDVDVRRVGDLDEGLPHEKQGGKKCSS